MRSEHKFIVVIFAMWVVSVGFVAAAEVLGSGRYEACIAHHSPKECADAGK
jgi:hypothetical protein